MPEWSKGVDSSSTSASCVGSNPTAVMRLSPQPRRDTSFVLPVLQTNFRRLETVWPSGLRRWLKAPVRKGVGSNPTAVTRILSGSVLTVPSDTNDPGRTRTCNPRLRRPMPYPLGHGAFCSRSTIRFGFLVAPPKATFCNWERLGGSRLKLQLPFHSNAQSVFVLCRRAGPDLGS